MQTNSAKVRKKNGGRRSVTKSRKAGATARAARNRNGATQRQLNNVHPRVTVNGEATHILVPLDEYERLIKADMVQRAIAQIESGDDDFVDADEFAVELATERIVRARKAKKWTQKQLGEKLGLPQSQISRIERNPNRTTVKTLKRIARALGVDVSSLI